MGYNKPSHDPVHKPGMEGSCPSMPTESINGKSFPNGDNPNISVSGSLPSSPDKGVDNKSKGGSPPTAAMPGA